MNTNITYTEDELGYTQAEREGIAWLAARGKWLEATVKRRSAKEFDLNIEGAYDADDGKDYSVVSREKTPYGEKVKMSATVRGFAMVKRQLFGAHFMLACLREFWGMGFIAAPHGDWSFIRDRDEDTNWRVFDGVLQKQRLKVSMVPMFSKNFLACCRCVWQAVAEDGTEFADNEDAIECILDADRLTMARGIGCDGEAANKELDELDKRLGYEVVMKELCRVLRFV